MAKAQSFKAEASKRYCDVNEQIPADISDDTIVDYSTWGDNYPVPITAGERRASQKEALARIAAEAAAKAAYEAVANEPPSFEEMEAQRIRYLRD